MKNYLLIRKYISEAIRGDIENVEIGSENEKEILRKAKDLKSSTGGSSPAGQFRKIYFDQHAATLEFNKYKNTPEFKALVDDEIQSRLKNEILSNNYKKNYKSLEDFRNNIPSLKEKWKEEIIDTKKKIFLRSYSSNNSNLEEIEEKLINSFRSSFVAEINKEKLRARVKNYEGINFKIFTAPTNINLINLLKKAKEKNPGIAEKAFSESGAGLTHERMLLIGENNNNLNLIEKLIEGLIKFQLAINSKEANGSTIDVLKSGLEQLMHGADESKKNGELFQVISMFEKIRDNIKSNPEDCHIIVYGISNVDDIKYLNSLNNTVHVTRSPWMTIHRLFDNSLPFNPGEMKKDSSSLYELYSSQIKDFFSRLGNLGYKMYMELLKKESFWQDVTIEDKFKFRIDFRNEEEREKFEKFNNDLLEDLSTYPILPKGIEKNNPSNRFFKKINKEETRNNFFEEGERPEGRSLTSVFKFQKINSDAHAVNLNEDFINELMVYLLGILKNKSESNYNIVSKAPGKEAVEKSLNIEELVEHMFLTDLNKFLKEHMNEEYSKFKKEVMIPMVKETIELMDIVLDNYKGKIALIGK